MCSLGDIENAIRVINNAGNSKISLLHCVSQYPCPIDQVNLLSMVTMRSAFQIPTGYSDHTIGKDVVLAAVSLGAEIIEKHFTLDKRLVGPDHKISMNPKEMTSMIKSIRNIESCLGDGIKKAAKCELDNILLLRRSLVFSSDIRKGETLTDSDITIKRPGDGIAPKYKDTLVGCKLTRSVIKDEPVEWIHFK